MRSRFRYGLVLSALFLVAVACSGPPQEADREGAGDVAESPEAIRPLLVGTTVPSCTLTTVDGEPFDLTAAIHQKPTVLIFYRGGW